MPRSEQLFVKTIDREELTLLSLKFKIIEISFVDVNLNTIYVHVPSEIVDGHNVESANVRDVLRDLNRGSSYISFSNTSAYRCGDYFYFELGDKLLKYKPWHPDVLLDHVALRFE